MKPRQHIWLATALLVLCTLAPAWLILQHEWLIRNGDEYRFKINLYDPYDPLRGRYIRLRLEGLNPLENVKGDWNRGDTAYLVLDAQGEFVKLAHLSQDPPATGPYLEATVRQHDRYNNHLTFENFYDRYYMNEEAAPEAEKMMRATRPGDARIWATINILKGKGVITGIYFDGTPVEQKIRE